MRKKLNWFFLPLIVILFFAACGFENDSDFIETLNLLILTDAQRNARTQDRNEWRAEVDAIISGGGIIASIQIEVERLEQLYEIGINTFTVVKGHPIRTRMLHEMMHGVYDDEGVRITKGAYHYLNVPENPTSILTSAQAIQFFNYQAEVDSFTDRFGDLLSRLN
ncbi:MAG: hypothetical protein FWC97_00085 [Treponema sp.]|nr:hypothetical protein [Treponema sp.]